MDRQKILWIWDRGGCDKANADTTTVSRISVLQLEELAVQQLAIGKSCGAIISGDKKCYQVGQPGATNLTLSGIESTLCEISILKTHQIVQVACGYHHICAIDKLGAVFCWGASKYGQCGVVTDTVTEPHVVRFTRTSKNVLVNNVACGKHHTMAISDKYELWGWGASHLTGGRNATRRNVPSEKPEIVEHLYGRKVFQVSCGKYHTVVLTEKLTKQPSSQIDASSSPVCNICKQEIYKMQENDDEVIITDTHVCSHVFVKSEAREKSSSDSINKPPLKVQTHSRSLSLPFFKGNSPLFTKTERLSKTPPSISLFSLETRNSASNDNIFNLRSEKAVSAKMGTIEMTKLNSQVNKQTVASKPDDAKVADQRALTPISQSSRTTAEPDDAKVADQRALNLISQSSRTTADIAENLSIKFPSSLPKSSSVPGNLFRENNGQIPHFPCKIPLEETLSMSSTPPGSKSSSITSLDDCKSRMRLQLPRSDSVTSDLHLDPEAALSYLKHLSPEPSEDNVAFFPDIAQQKSANLENEESTTKNEMEIIDEVEYTGSEIPRQTISERITQSITDNQLLSPLTNYSKNMLTGVFDGIEWIKTSTYDKGVAPIRDLWTKDKVSGSHQEQKKIENNFKFINDNTGVSDPLRSTHTSDSMKDENDINDSDENNLTLHTEVWTWGENNYGELGMADVLDRFHPVCVKTLSHRGVVKIKCGSHHTLALTSNSEVYTWGSNKHGQLGHNDTNTSSPAKINCKNRIWDICGGRHHTLLLVDGISDEPSIVLCGQDEDYKSDLMHPLKFNDKKNANKWKIRPVDFSRKMGFQCKVIAGFSTLSSCLAEKRCSGLIQSLHSFSKSERSFYQQITLIKTDILRPLKFSDLYKNLDKTTCGELLSQILDLFGSLSYDIGLNTVHLTQAIISRKKCQKHTFTYIGSNLMQSYEKYFHTLNDAIAYGFFERCEQLSTNIKSKSKFLLQPKILQIFKELLGDKRLSKLPSENFLQILQLPAFRLREYANMLNKISIASDEELNLSSFLEHLSTKWEELWMKINNQLQFANNTRGFWKNDFKFGAGGKLAESLKKVGRYLVIHSKKIPLDIAHSGRFSMNWFILFNDCLVLVHYGSHYIHPLNILWCSPVTESKEKGHFIKIITPEEEIMTVAGNEVAKSSWINSLNRAINLAISKSNFDGMNNSQHHMAPPSTRHATYSFTKYPELKGAKYSGAWLNGKPDGKGEMNWSDGRTYKGNYKNGKENGFGEWKCGSFNSTKIKYQGWWKDGKMDGYGKLWYSQQQAYEGSFCAGLREGHGVLRTGSVTEGLVYVGAWKKDQRNGFGVEDNITKGEKYLGMWLNNEKHGIGILVTLDGLYGQSRFSHGEMSGDTLLIEGRYVFEGPLTAGLILNGKGRLTLPTGDKLEGSFSGPWGETIRVSGNLIRLDTSHSSSNRASSPGTPIDVATSFTHFSQKDHARSILRRYNRHIMRKHFENKHFRSFPLSLHPDMKWTEVFSQCRISLGCPIKDVEEKPDTMKIWDSISIALSNAKRKREDMKHTRLSPQKKSDESKLHWLEKIPSVVTDSTSNILTKDGVNCIREYLTQAFSTTLHPLGELVETLGNVFRDSYSGTGAHKWLLTQAVADVRSFVRRSYDILQYMFPMLENDHGSSHMKIVNAESEENAYADFNLVPEEVTAGDLLLPVLLPKVYPTLFTLYALRNENEDKSYWERVTRLNRHPDVALLSFLGVKPKFWLLDEKEIPPLETSPEDGQLYDSVEQAESSKWRHLLVATARDCSFLNAVETLQLISTTFIPAEKLNVIHSTFKEINATVLKHCKENHTWSMDDLFPVFQYVVIRSRISHLGCEIQLVEDFLEPDMCKGEKGIMFTTLKACYFQIRVEKDL